MTMAGFQEYDNYDGLGLGQLVRDGEISAYDLLEEAIDRIERVNGELNAVVYKYYDEARTAIEAPWWDRRPPLHAGTSR